MAQIKFFNLKIRLSELHTQGVSVPAWEAPLLEALHGDNVSVTGDKVVEYAVPDAGSEYKRLQDRYRAKDGQLPAVAAVFGSFGLGVSNLNRAINDSIIGGVSEEQEGDEQPISAGDIEAEIRAQVQREKEAADAAAQDGAAKQAAVNTQTGTGDAGASKAAAEDGSANIADTAVKDAGFADLVGGAGQPE